MVASWTYVELRVIGGFIGAPATRAGRPACTATVSAAHAPSRSTPAGYRGSVMPVLLSGCGQEARRQDPGSSAGPHDTALPLRGPALWESLGGPTAAALSWRTGRSQPR